MENGSTICALALLAGLGSVPIRAARAQEDPRKPVRHALLVGCSEYPSLRAALGEKYERELVLRGPEGDVELVRDTLQHVLQLAPERTSVLAGWKADAKTRPTRANILGELERLAREARTGDQVIVYLAGHGSQQRVQRVKTEEESDGLEELFLPADVRPAEKDQGYVPNSIRDDELGKCVGAIRDTGAEVWLIVDACHSGTLLRGGDGTTGESGVRLRGIDPALLGVSSELRGGPGPRSSGGDWLDAADSSATTRIAAFYAATSYGRAPEMELPRESPDAQPHGLFTYLFCQELQRAGKETTYRELADRVVAAYQSFPCAITVPTAEGDLDRDLAGGLPREPDLTCNMKSGVLFLNQGKLAGLEPGVELALMDLDEGSEHPVGRMVVTDSDLFQARGKLLSGELGDGKRPWRARADARPLGDYGLALALVRADGTAAAMGDLPEPARRALEGEAARFRVVPDPQAADWWIVLAQGGGFSLRPGPREGGFDVFGVGAEDLVPRLTAIQKTRNLRRFAGGPFSAEWRDDLDVWVERRTARGGWQRLARDAVLRPGDKIKVLLQKKTDAIYDVNVFYLDANFGAQCLRPSPRLAPTAREAIDLVGEQTITDDALGLENVLVFATPRTESSREVQLCPVVEQKGVLRGAPDPFEELIDAVAKGERMRSGPVRVADAGGTQSLLETLRTEWGELAPPPWPQAIAPVERPERAPPEWKPELGRAVEAGAEELPDPWDFGTRAALARSPAGDRFDLLLLGDAEVEVVLVDFDPPAEPPGKDAAELVRTRGFDAEAAFYFGACRLAWYDHANRGVFDLALEDADADGVAETRWSRASDASARWQRDERVALPWLSQAYVSPGTQRRGEEKIVVSRRLQALQRPP